MPPRRLLVTCIAAALGAATAVVPSMAAVHGRTVKPVTDPSTTKPVKTSDDTTTSTTTTTTTTTTTASTTASTTTPPPETGTSATTEATPPPPPAPTPAETVLAAPVRPVLGRSVTLAPVSGTVTVRLPGAATAIPLGAAHQLPTGTRIDTRAGAVKLRSAVTATTSQTGTFSNGVFTVRQARTSRATTQLVLSGGSFAACPRATSRSLASAARAPRVVRRLWGGDHGGRFTTVGRGSAATVRGTRWLTEDRCDGTRTVVLEGAVSVLDRTTHHRTLVRAGHSLLIKHR